MHLNPLYFIIPITFLVFLLCMYNGYEHIKKILKENKVSVEKRPYILVERYYITFTSYFEGRNSGSRIFYWDKDNKQWVNPIIEDYTMLNGYLSYDEASKDLKSTHGNFLQIHKLFVKHYIDLI